MVSSGESLGHCMSISGSNRTGPPVLPKWLCQCTATAVWTSTVLTLPMLALLLRAQQFHPVGEGYGSLVCTSSLASEYTDQRPRDKDTCAWIRQALGKAGRKG